MNVEFRVDHRLDNGEDNHQEPHDEQEQGNKRRPYDRKRKKPLATRGDDPDHRVLVLVRFAGIGVNSHQIPLDEKSALSGSALRLSGLLWSRRFTLQFLRHRIELDRPLSPVFRLERSSTLPQFPDDAGSAQ